jgi:single-strand DNA-binding protein
MFQQITIVGNLGKDPEMRYTPDGTPVTNFSVAVTKKWDGGEKTTWFKVAAWRKLAETCNQYLTKGRQVMVIGEVDVESFSRQDGTPGASLVLTAREVKFLGSAQGQSNGASNQTPQYAEEEEAY